MTTIRAHFDGKVFVPDEPVEVPVNTPVTIHVESPRTIEDFDAALEDLTRLAKRPGGEVDWSRDSIYSGTLDDPR